MNGRAPAIIDHLASLADTTRNRLLLVLDRHELTVSELCTVTQLPQSTVRRQLRILSDAGFIVARGEGTARYYSLASSRLEPNARQLWNVVREQSALTSGAAHDLK